MSRAALPEAADVPDPGLVQGAQQDKIIEQHIAWLATWARPTTVTGRRRSLGRFVRAAGVHPITATRLEVEAWFGALTTTSVTRTSELSHLTGFYKWAQVFEHRPDDPTARIRRPKPKLYVPRPIGAVDVRAALNNAPGRVKPMLWLMVGCGLRSCEVAGLRAGDIMRPVDGETVGRLYVADGKGGKPRIVPAPALVLAALRGLPNRGHLFLRADGKPGPVTAHRVSNMVNEYLHSIGIEETAHALRHTYATALRREVGDLLVVRDILGHVSVRATEVYVRADSEGSDEAAARALDGLVGPS